jgi:hemerythrin
MLFKCLDPTCCAEMKGNTQAAAVVNPPSNKEDLMSVIQWGKEFETGNVQVDMQHKKLFAMVNELDQGVSQGKGREVIGHVLDELAAYVVEHFATEERLMQTLKYPDYTIHKVQHDTLAKQATDIIKGYKSGEMVLPVTLTQFLGDWLRTHINNHDKKMIQWVKTQTGR